MVLQADDRQFGLVVDEINDTEEIVVKPLGKQLKGIACFAGATIMGDGRVALILDVLGIAQMANVVTEVRDHAGRVCGEGRWTRWRRADAWLLFTVGRGGGWRSRWRFRGSRSFPPIGGALGGSGGGAVSRQIMPLIESRICWASSPRTGKATNCRSW